MMADAHNLPAQRVSFFFLSNEGTEPPHVYVERGGDTAKFWLLPEVAVGSTYGFNGHELLELARLVAENRADFLRKWHEFFGKPD